MCGITERVTHIPETVKARMAVERGKHQYRTQGRTFSP
jgi:hypothetical protein